MYTGLSVKVKLKGNCIIQSEQFKNVGLNLVFSFFSLYSLTVLSLMIKLYIMLLNRVCCDEMCN